MKKIMILTIFIIAALVPAGILKAVECPANAHRAEDGNCYCDTGFHAAKNRTGCEQDCQFPTIYDPGLGTCVCMAGFQWDEELERCVSMPTSACPQNSALSGGICLCNTGYYFDSRAGYCVRPPEQCPDHATPNGLGCECDPGYRFDEAGRLCLSFQDSVSCPEGSKLVGTQCVCQPPYTVEGGQCVYHTSCHPYEFVRDESGATTCIGGSQCAWEPKVERCSDSILTQSRCELKGYWDLLENRCLCRPPFSIQGFFLDEDGRHLVCCLTGNAILPDGRCTFR